MRLALFLFLAGCAVKCEDSSNYFLIEMPDPPRDSRRPLRVYWNVPTMQCKSKRIPFDNLQKYGIIQNEGDSFRGEMISILYDPGLFPALFPALNESGKFRTRNGGVPQEGNLEKHLESFKSVLEQSVPDAEFSGLGVIDFESWRPVFRQNFGVLVPYKDVSVEMERKMHWWWPKSWLVAEATKRFEESGQLFMQNTIAVAKQMRPRAVWGYYGYPYCFNMAQNKMEKCADKVPQENDRIHWLWSESTALYPSVYSSYKLSADQLTQLIRGRIKEAARVRRPGTPILPYFWYRYLEDGASFLREEDLHAALETFSKSEASGFIIWGGSKDVNTIDKCKALLKYVENVLGPAVAKYTKNNNKVSNDDDEDTYPFVDLDSFTTDTVLIASSPMNVSNFDVNFTSTTMNPKENDAFVDKSNQNVNNSVFGETSSNIQKVLNLDLDPEFKWDPPANYSQDIVKYVEKEFNKKNTTETQSEGSKLVNLNANPFLTLMMTFQALVKQKDSDNYKVNTQNYNNSITGVNKSNFETITDIVIEETEYDLETSTYREIKSPSRTLVKNIKKGLPKSVNDLTNLKDARESISSRIGEKVVIATTTENDNIYNLETENTFMTEENNTTSISSLEISDYLTFGETSDYSETTEISPKILNYPLHKGDEDITDRTTANDRIYDYYEDLTTNKPAKNEKKGLPKHKVHPKISVPTTEQSLDENETKYSNNEALFRNNSELFKQKNLTNTINTTATYAPIINKHSKNRKKGFPYQINHWANAVQTESTEPKVENIDIIKKKGLIHKVHVLETHVTTAASSSTLDEKYKEVTTETLSGLALSADLTVFSPKNSQKVVPKVRSIKEVKEQPTSESLSTTATDQVVIHIK